jgi:hypothetical protein
VEPNSTIQFTLSATNANYAQLGIRQNEAHKFDYYQMYDDGLHGDGAANDGVFGVSVQIGYGNVQYYAWAENASQGVFYPARAEHEFCNIDVISPTGGIQFTEINYNSSDEFDAGDWVEIYNPGPDAVDVTNWQFKDGNDNHVYTIPAGTVLQANEYLALCQSHTDFSTCFPLVTNVIGEFGFGLSGSGEAIRLYTSSGEIVDSVFYGVVYPWTPEANGSGSTLELISVDLDNSLPQNWQASSGHGTPGSPNSSVNVADNLAPFVVSALSSYPNPFRTLTTITYKNTVNMKATLCVYNIRGQKVRTLVDTYFSPGNHSVSWDGTDNHQTKLSSGIYFVVLHGDKTSKVQKLVLLR